LASNRPALCEEALQPARTTWRLEKALDLPERLSLEGDQRTRYEYIDNQIRAGRSGSDHVLALRTRVRAELRITDWLSLAGEFQDSRAYLHDGNTPLGTGLVNSVELLQARIDLDFDGPWGGRHSVELFRTTKDIGSRRLVARNRYRNTSNSFDGLWWKWQKGNGLALQLFYWFPIQRKPLDRESLARNAIEFDKEQLDFQFFGLFLEGDVPWGDEGELYLFGVWEDGSFDPTDSAVTPNRRLLTGGFRLLREPRKGHFDYEVESVLQGGRSRRLELDHFAHFHHLALGYTFDTSWSPQLTLHYDYGSGDEDPTDNSNDRFDTLFGARRFEFGPTSIYGAFARENINTPGLRLRLKPARRWTSFIDYRAVWLAQKRDEWVPNRVRDPTGRSGSFVGQQIEMRIRWHLLPGNVILEFGYAHLFAGEFIDKAPNANRGDTNYVYSQIILDF
jgi:hypothetical protein